MCYWNFGCFCGIWEEKRLSRPHRWGPLIREPGARPATTVNRMASPFMTGITPGYPRQTGQTLLFGGAPYRALHEQNIFEFVLS